MAGAAFGVFPHVKKKRTKQDPEAAKNVPLSVARGWLAGGLGLPGDVEGLGRAGINLLGGNVDSTPALPTTDFFNEWLPLRADGASNRAGEAFGNLFGGAGTAAATGLGAKAFTVAAKKNAGVPSKGAAGGKFKQRGVIEVVPKKLQGLKLKGLPDKVVVDGTEEIYTGFRPAQEAAEKLARDRGIDYIRPDTFANIDPARAKRIAAAFEAMKHNPQDPTTKAAYQALIEETMAQYAAARRAGLKVDFMPESGDPYGNPRNALKDIYQNNHMYVFPTDSGFGGSLADKIEDNPLLALTDEKISGKPARANDIFRVVHDYFGHAKEGVGFRAAGEENAWQQHASMFPELSKRAMTTETRGQNSWVNFGPHGDFNKTASPTETEYAAQKIGLLPEWASSEGQVAATPKPTGGGGGSAPGSIVRKKAEPRTPVRKVTPEFEPWDSKLWNRDELKRLAEQPDVPQYNLPRAQPARGPSARALDLASNEKALKQYDKFVDKGLREHGSGAWFNTDPLRRDFMEVNGPVEGNRMHRDYIRMVAGSSTGSRVQDNARNGSFYFVNQGNLPKQTPLPQPYGHKMQQNHLRHALDYEAGNEWDFFANPKPASFDQNLLGNWEPITADKHYVRGLGMVSKDPRWLKPSWQEDKGKPVMRPQDEFAAGRPLDSFGPNDFADSPNANEYGLLEQIGQKRAAKKGIRPAQYQAAGWTGMGEVTGLGSPPQPFLQVLEQRVLLTAQQRGETPAKVYRDFITRKKPLLGAGAGGAGVGAEQQGLFED